MCDRPYCTCPAYDALLAERDKWRNDDCEHLLGLAQRSEDLHWMTVERDALKESLALEREQVEIGADARSKLYNEVQAYTMEKRAEIDALMAELAALKEKAERLHTDFRNATIMNLDAGQECEKCEKWWKYDSPIVERHAPDCPAHPDFLTTSATESRGAKGGTT